MSQPNRIVVPQWNFQLDRYNRTFHFETYGEAFGKASRSGGAELDHKLAIRANETRLAVDFH